MCNYFEIILPDRSKNAQRIIGYINSDGCWLCKTLAKDFDGYVKIHIHGKDTRLHRAVYEEFIGSIPDNLFVMHNCDVAGCCNPDHLEAGTAAENNLAKKLRGRQGNLKRRLSMKEKKEICESHKPIAELARIYDVSRTTIRNTKRNFKEPLKKRLEPDKPSIPLQKPRKKSKNKASNQ